jgi:hypothetical protein
MSGKKDWTGEKFGRLTFVRPTDRKGKSTEIIWEAQCECGELAYVSPYQVKSGSTRSCGCLRKEWAAETCSKNGTRNRKYTPVISNARLAWKMYKYDGLTFEDFYTLSQQNCDYCGAVPSNVSSRRNTSRKTISTLQREEGDFTYNGLDRVDPKKGHTLDNVCPCCWPCNRAKGDMTRDEFIAHNERIYLHQRKNTPTH